MKADCTRCASRKSARRRGRRVGRAGLSTTPRSRRHRHGRAYARVGAAVGEPRRGRAWHAPDAKLDVHLPSNLATCWPGRTWSGRRHHRHLASWPVGLDHGRREPPSGSMQRSSPCRGSRAPAVALVCATSSSTPHRGSGHAHAARLRRIWHAICHHRGQHHQCPLARVVADEEHSSLERARCAMRTRPGRGVLVAGRADCGDRHLATPVLTQRRARPSRRRPWRWPVRCAPGHPCQIRRQPTANPKHDAGVSGAVVHQTQTRRRQTADQQSGTWPPILELLPKPRADGVAGALHLDWTLLRVVRRQGHASTSTRRRLPAPRRRCALEGLRRHRDRGYEPHQRPASCWRPPPSLLHLQPETRRTSPTWPRNVPHRANCSHRPGQKARSLTGCHTATRSHRTAVWTIQEASFANPSRATFVIWRGRSTRLTPSTCIDRRDAIDTDSNTDTGSRLAWSLARASLMRGLTHQTGQGAR
jgi:hypothetical protein